MGYCSVKCGKSTNNTSYQKDGITFHQNVHVPVIDATSSLDQGRDSTLVQRKAQIPWTCSSFPLELPSSLSARRFPTNDQPSQQFAGVDTVDSYPRRKYLTPRLASSFKHYLILD